MWSVQEHRCFWRPEAVDCSEVEGAGAYEASDMSTGNPVGLWEEQWTLSFFPFNLGATWHKNQYHFLYSHKTYKPKN